MDLHDLIFQPTIAYYKSANLKEFEQFDYKNGNH